MIDAAFASWEADRAKRRDETPGREFRVRVCGGQHDGLTLTAPRAIPVLSLPLPGNAPLSWLEVNPSPLAPLSADYVPAGFADADGRYVFRPA